MEVVKHINIKSNMKVSELIREMGASGVMGANRIAKAVDIFKKMINDKDCKVFFGLAGAMVPGGMKNIIIDMIKNKHIDVLVTTGANITHDLIEALGHRHYKSIYYDDKELYDRKIYRIFDSFMKSEVYETLENFFNENFENFENSKSTKEFLWSIGKILKNKNSILKECYKNKTPIFCPALSDSGIGLMIWGQLLKNKKINFNQFSDLNEIIDIVWSCKKAGVFYIGGGVPKNYIQQAIQFSPKSAKYGIQIKVDRQEFGGSSGANLKEGISWGKLSKNADFVDVICDATIALPLIYSAVKQ